MIEQHYSTRELAKRLSVSTRTIRRAVERGDLQPVRIGKDFRFSESAVRAWLAAGDNVVHLARHQSRRTP